MLAEEAANSKDVSEIIEEERAKVDAKTPITEVGHTSRLRGCLSRAVFQSTALVYTA